MGGVSDMFRVELGACMAVELWMCINGVEHDQGWSVVPLDNKYLQHREKKRGS